MESNNSIVFNFEECIKSFKQQYKVSKKQKHNIINYIFNIYLVIKNNNEGNIGNIDNKDGNIDNKDGNIANNITIQLDNEGIAKLLSYVKMIPKKYALESKTKTNLDTEIESETYDLNNNKNNNSSNNSSSNNKKILPNVDTNISEIIKHVVKRKRCLGRTAKHIQCSRSCKGTLLFCQSHINNNCPYGRIDKAIEQPIEKVVKKRGRKRKIEISANFNDPNYTTMWPEIVSGNKFLVDRFNNVYSFNTTNPKYIGIKQLNGSINTISKLSSSVFK